jgi:CBS-domain-containing membrane protein
VATRLAVHGLERLPVVKDAQSRELLGVVSRSDLVKPSLGSFDEEDNYEQFQSLPFDGVVEAFRRR